MAKKTLTEKERTDKPLAFTPVIKRRVTLPLWKWQENTTKFLRFDGEIHKGKEIKGTKDGVKMEPADLANVTDLASKQMCQMICGTLLNGNLTEAYPEHGYVGKCFAITQRKVTGKRYKEYEISEIEEPKIEEKK